MTALSAKYEGNYVIALLEGRGVAREVGMAALDKDTGKVMLVQLCVEDDERAGTVIAVSNKCVHILSSLSAKSIYPLVNLRYYALSATCALFKHAEAKMNTRFATGSLRIRYVPVEGTMMIDPDTARNLELVENMTYRKSAHSLFGVLNHTYTAMASRLLRVNLLSPITVQTSIDARLDVVEGIFCIRLIKGWSTYLSEFIRTEDRYTEVRDALKAFNKMDFDKLIVSLASQEVRVANTAKVASSRILQMLNLRNVVKNLPLLQKALAGSQSQLLRIIHDLISDERLTKIESLVTANLNEDGAPAKGGIGAVNARVYAVKAHRNRLLDVARETYKENVGDIFQLNRTLSEEHELPFVLVYQETGFVYTLKKTDLEGELPPGFTNVSVKKGKWVFTSMDLQKMNARMKDALDETLMLSDAA
ncbi:hypothetical protein C0989_010489 [Termitomyces sp. Mn162]|nr:hypothetical protein C0989_010489 [Termitomyces sp. Mn162]